MLTRADEPSPVLPNAPYRDEIGWLLAELFKLLPLSTSRAPSRALSLLLTLRVETTRFQLCSAPIGRSAFPLCLVHCLVSSLIIRSKLTGCRPSALSLRSTPAFFLACLPFPGASPSPAAFMRKTVDFPRPSGLSLGSGAAKAWTAPFSMSGRAAQPDSKTGGAHERRCEDWIAPRRRAGGGSTSGSKIFRRREKKV